MPQNSKNTSNVIDFRKELKDRESEIELLQDTFRLIASELNLERVFDTVAKRAIHLVHAETLLIPILDNNNETYTYRAGAGKNTDEIVGESLPLDFGVCGWVWKNKKAWWRGVLNELNETERNQWEKEAGTLILVPLQGRKHFLGGIAAINKQDGLEFTQRDLNMLTMFAGIVSIAIENALAVKELEETQSALITHKHRLERLNKQYSESNKKVEQLTLYDPLTGIPNRTLLRDRINRQLSLSSIDKAGISFLLIDINNFKSINDALGHDKGDQILIEFCNRIKKHLKPDETLGRLGSDEFILLLPKTSEEETISRANNILNEIKSAYIINNKEFNIDACIGISHYPEHGEDRETLLRHADIALNIAKERHSKFHIFNNKEDETDESQLNMAIDLNHAFEKQQFKLYYQPKIDIKTDTIISTEALGRWTHPERGVISPVIFIEALEQYNLIDKYTYEAIDTAVKNIHKWSKEGHNLKIAINISSQTLMNPDFIKHVQSRVSDFSISRRLIFEITESLFLSDHDYIFDTLTRLRSIGIELSIDDFGTGYSSLSRLKKLPVNELKIDQSFIRDMMANLDDQIIVKSIIDLAHNLGLSVVAEGVETKEILNHLNRLGCDIAQGYLIAKPMPAKEFEVFLNTYK
ncbi:MAG: EAL domain-containing protein [Gammaproteobacteria bacterium]|nr:EAL domain-containing protein [Gammaproteobacteria bacterium]